MDSVNYGAEGTVFDIQRFSVHDGPGVRTIVFLKGCPLSCLWCCNPESQRLEPVVMFQEPNCIRCGKCLNVCKTGAIQSGRKGLVDRERCVGCGECANICPASALVMKGERMSVEETVKELKKDATVYRRSGGGVTLSGGEALVQWRYTAELLKACKSQGWHTAMETTAFGSADAIETVFPYVDLVLLDIKSMDDQIHKRVTGVSNERILENAKRIADIAHVVVRVPAIPGINATVKDFEAICRFAKTLRGVDTLHLLPYHTYGENKYDLLGTDYAMKGIPALSPEQQSELKETVERQELTCIIGG